MSSRPAWRWAPTRASSSTTRRCSTATATARPSPPCLGRGAGPAPDVINPGLAMGADEGVLLNDAALFDGDSYSTAVALAAAIEKLGPVDIVICGRQATDWDCGVP